MGSAVRAALEAALRPQRRGAPLRERRKPRRRIRQRAGSGTAPPAAAAPGAHGNGGPAAAALDLSRGSLTCCLCLRRGRQGNVRSRDDPPPRARRSARWPRRSSDAAGSRQSRAADELTARRPRSCASAGRRSGSAARWTSASAVSAVFVVAAASGNRGGAEPRRLDARADMCARTAAAAREESA